MSTLQDILKLVANVQSQDELRVVGQAINQRWRVLQNAVVQKTVQDKDILPGNFVSFTARGQTHYGTVKQINQKTCTVDVPSGIPGVSMPCRLSPGLLTKLDKLPEPAPKKSEEDLMKEILNCYGALSPENLTCDGEASRAHIQRRSRELNTRLQAAFRQLGRTVSETEAYDWHRKQAV